MSELSYPIELPIADREVIQVTLSRSTPYLMLEFFETGVGATANDGYTLSIEGAFTYESGHERVEVDPSSPSPIVLNLPLKRVRQALADEDGTLRVRFADGDLMTVPPNEYEPWQFGSRRSAVDGGWLVVSAAGGGLAVWLPEAT